MQEINLLQNKVKDRTLQFERSNRLVISIFALIFILEIGSVVGLYLLGKTTEASTQKVMEKNLEIQRAMSKDEKELSLAQGLQAQLKNVRTLLSNHVYWTSFYEKLSSITPTKIQLTGVDGAITDGKFHAEGMAASYTDVGRLILSLSTTPNFTDVKLLSVGASQEDKQGYSFSISFKVAANTFTKQ